MARPDWSPAPRSLAASAAIVDVSTGVARRHTKAKRDWQDKGWEYYDLLPEIRYPANYTGSALSRFLPLIGLLPADDLNGRPVVPTEKNDVVKAAEEQLASLEGQFGGVREILFRYGVNMSVAGEGWLVGLDEGDETLWEFLSVKEISFKQESYRGTDRPIAQRDPLGDGQPFELGPGTMLRRFWRPHSEYSYLADAAIQSLLDDCQRLVALNDSITSRLINRLAQAGILFLPSQLSSTTSVENTASTGEGEASKDPLINQLITYFTRAIQDRSSAVGALPIIVRGPSEVAEAIRHITLDRAIDDIELKLREETRQTIARGLDLPPEVQQGLGEASHWTTWGVMDSSFRNALQPTADRFGEGLTRVFIRPALEGLYDPEEIRRVVVVMDGADVVARPNEAEDGRQLHDRLVLSDAALRKRSGVPEEEAPAEDEYVRQLGRDINDPYLATYGMEVAKKIDWDKVGSNGQKPGAPGVGSLPTNRRPADSSDPAGAPGESRGEGAGGVGRRGQNQR